MICKVYRYGLLAPEGETAETVRKHIRLAHEYRNTLVEIDRQERAEIRALQTSHGSIPALDAAAKAAIQAREAAYAAVKASKAQSRSRKVPEPLAAQYDLAKQAAQAAAADLRQARLALKSDASVSAKRDEISMRYSEKRKAARAASGIYWGSYLRVEAADQAARRTTPMWRGADPSDVRFARWRGDGGVAVQIQSGPAPHELHKNNFCRIETRAAPARADKQSKRSAKRRYATLLVRIGSDDERQAIWARFPMVMHRPLPDDAHISWVTVTRKMIGPREEWAALFTVKYEQDKRPRPPAEPVNRIGVDLGWRKMQDGSIRVASWRTDSGQHGTLLLDPDMISQAEKAEGLRRTRDENLNATRCLLVERIKSLTLPSWFPNNVWQWRSQARFAALTRRWKDNRFPGDDVAYAEMEAWRYHDYHLWQWETSQRTKALRHRLDFYRVFAARMARTYTGLVIEDWDMRDTAEKPDAHEQEGDNEQARSNRVKSAVSELRRALVQAFVNVAKVPAAYTTQTCSACGAIEKWDQAAQLEHTCSACGAHWDQDDNAAKNLLQYREPVSDDTIPAASRGAEKVTDPGEVQESRWKKAKRMGEEKRARVEAARNTVPSATG